jgi:hypothetical protein
MNRIAAGAMVAAMALAACSSAPTQTPQIIYVTEPPTVAPTQSPTAISAATPSASLSPCPEAPKPTSYFCATKNGEGGHGGPPPLDLPARLRSTTGSAGCACSRWASAPRHRPSGCPA